MARESKKVEKLSLRNWLAGFLKREIPKIVTDSVRLKLEEANTKLEIEIGQELGVPTRKDYSDVDSRIRLDSPIP